MKEQLFASPLTYMSENWRSPLQTSRIFTCFCLLHIKYNPQRYSVLFIIWCRDLPWHLSSIWLYPDKSQLTIRWWWILFSELLLSCVTGVLCVCRSLTRRSSIGFWRLRRVKSSRPSRPIFLSTLSPSSVSTERSQLVILYSIGCLCNLRSDRWFASLEIKMLQLTLHG